MSSPVPAPPPDASSTRRGLVNTLAQSFEGIKTFVKRIVVTGGIQFADASVQTTAAVAPDLSGYETSAHAASTYLPLAGGTLTGPLIGTEYRVGAPVGLATAKVRVAAASPTLYLEDTSVASGGVSTAGIFFGNLATAFSWVINGVAGTSANDSKEFRLGDGNTVHWSARVPASGNNNSRLFFGAFGVTASTDGAFNFKHLLNPGTGVGNDISTLIVKGDTGAANHGGKILDLQDSSSVSKHTFSLAGDAAHVGAVTGSNLSGTNTGDVTIGTANGLSRSGQVLSMATAVAAGANGSLLGTDKTKLDALTGTNSGDVTIGTANGLSLASQALSLANVVAAGASGAMTGADKTKLDAITGTHTGTNTGDVTIGAFGSSPTANALSISSQVVTAQPADGSNPGAISTAAQVMGAGIKKFGGGVELGGAVSSFTTTQSGATIGTHTGFPGIWFLGVGVTPTLSNYAFLNAGDNILNSPSGNVTRLRVNNANVLAATGSSVDFSFKATFPTTDNSASPGATTINKPSGRAAVALGATSVVVTCSVCTATSDVYISPLDIDTNAAKWKVAPAAGSFTVTVNTATAAAWRFSFLVVNA